MMDLSLLDGRIFLNLSVLCMEPNGCPIHFRSNVQSLTEQPEENAGRKSRVEPTGAEAKESGERTR